MNGVYAEVPTLQRPMSDVISFGEREAAGIQVVYRTSDVVAQRRTTVEALDPRPGERGVDVGAGPGFLACEVAHRVGDDGWIAAVDPSASMLLAARRRAEEEGVPGRMALLRGDAQGLPLADGRFDFVVSTQVFEYVPDVGGALGEAYRVLRRGGRLVVLDTDWGTLVWHSDDPSRMDRVARAWSGHLVHNHLPRRLPALLRDTGFEVEAVSAVPIVNWRHDPDTYSYRMIPTIASYARKRGLPSEEVDAWVSDLERQGDRGTYFFSLNRYQFIARRPRA